MASTDAEDLRTKIAVALSSVTFPVKHEIFVPYSSSIWMCLAANIEVHVPSLDICLSDDTLETRPITYQFCSHQSYKMCPQLLATFSSFFYSPPSSHFFFCSSAAFFIRSVSHLLSAVAGRANILCQFLQHRIPTPLILLTSVKPL
jgi:hypothetical protein